MFHWKENYSTFERKERIQHSKELKKMDATIHVLKSTLALLSPTVMNTAELIIKRINRDDFSTPPNWESSDSLPNVLNMGID